MTQRTLHPHRDPFATLISLTAAALIEPVTPRAGAARTSDQPAAKAVSLWDRLDHWLWKLRQQDLERALTSAVDVADIEARLRDRERRLFHRYY